LHYTKFSPTTIGTYLAVEIDGTVMFQLTHDFTLKSAFIAQFSCPGLKQGCQFAEVYFNMDVNSNSFFCETRSFLSRFIGVIADVSSIYEIRTNSDAP